MKQELINKRDIFKTALVLLLISGRCLACSSSFTDSFAGNVVTFTNTSVASPTATYQWYFGDGTGSSTMNPIHDYIYPGKYFCCLYLTDTYTNCTDLFCDSVELPNTCVSNYTYTLSGYTFSFFDNSFGSPTQWHWNFSDGTTSNAQNPTHVFSNMGDYYVCLTISDSGYLCYSTSCQEVYVPYDSGTQCNACYTKHTGSDSTLFYDCSMSINQITQWNWDFGDGASSTQQNPIHSYAALGIYTACLTTTDDSGCVSTYCDTVRLIFPDCHAVFSDSPGGISVYFYDVSNAGLHQSKWTFGDGDSSAQTNPSHSYSSPGTYTVCLTIDDSALCHSFSCNEISIGGGGVLCQADFVLHPDSFQQGLYWGYNLATGSNFEYFWSWGDGTTSTGPYPSHQYSDSTFYNICMGIHDTVSGCADSFCAYYLIQKMSQPMNILQVIFVNIATGTHSSNAIPEWHFFPNPAGNSVHFEADGEKLFDEIDIADVSGKIVLAIHSPRGKEVSLEALQDGVYIVKALIEGRWSSKLLIKQ